MIPIEKAVKIVIRETSSLGEENLALEKCVGRVLAEDIRADGDLPPFDRSQMDGFAVKAKDTAEAPAILKIVGESAAGHGWHKKMKAGEAVRIMTGAPVPVGADSVQKVELTEERNGFVAILERVERGKNIVERGTEIKKRTRLIKRGEMITERNIASLAAFGYAKVLVAVRPRVSVLATGSEIVAVGKTPGRDQIRNSNSVMLKSLCEKAGADVRIAPGSVDDLAKLKKSILRAVGSGREKSDVLVITGGVSVGKYDLTKAALRELGGKIFFERVRLRPGKPTVFARLRDTLIFGLPGNPVSAAVTFYLFARLAILRMQKAAQTSLPTGTAVLSAATKAAAERDTYVPATLCTDESGRLLATPLKWHGSSDFVGFARADGLISLSRGSTGKPGETVQILFL